MCTHATTASYHSIERSKERANLNQRQAEKRIEKAFARGKGAEEFSSWEYNFLAKKTADGFKALAYSGFCYIFDADNRCVTLYPLPVWFGKRKSFEGKAWIRDPKKYVRYSSKSPADLQYAFA